MNIIIKNDFKLEEANSLTYKIFNLIKRHKNLTPRSKKQIRYWIKSKSILIAYYNNEITGFIVKNQISQNYYEIKSFLVLNKFRKQGIGKKLLTYVTNQENHNYLLSTFQTSILNKAKKLDFKITNYNQLPTLILIKILLSKNIKSIIKHLFKNKSYLLIKNANN